MSEKEFINELKKINIVLSKNQIQQFFEYYKFLVEYNIHTNLTTIVIQEDVYLKHFYDSLLLSQVVDLNKIENLLDIGCGAGFPGIVLKIVFPHINLTLLDSNNKKTKFCKELIEKLKLNNVEIITDRAENFIINRREYYDLVTARAVKNLPVLSEISLPYVKVDGFFIAMKSDYEKELNDSMNAISILGGKLISTKNINLPNNKGVRNFIIIIKNKITNTKYPRNYSQIVKKHL